nr:three finger toxin 2 [Protobothrops flavoviridis]
MKTLLLILGVVAFVYLDSGFSLICNTCNRTVRIPLIPCDPVTCPEGLDQCYANRTGILRMKVERGCTTNCTQTLTLMCCKRDMCN